MRLSCLLSLVVLATTLAGASSASAGWVNELGRRTGLGWSDGYHAYEGCPDSRLRSQPWQRRANRGGAHEEPLVPYLEPAPAPQPAPTPQPAPEQIPPRPKTTRASRPAATPTSPPTRTSQLHISRPNY
jgi:hypothetical protein